MAPRSKSAKDAEPRGLGVPQRASSSPPAWPGAARVEEAAAAASRIKPLENSLKNYLRKKNYLRNFLAPREKFVFVCLSVFVCVFVRVWVMVRGSCAP